MLNKKDVLWLDKLEKILESQDIRPDADSLLTIYSGIQEIVNNNNKAEIERLKKKIEELLKMANNVNDLNTKLHNENIEIRNQVKELKERLHIIFALGFDYDGCGTVESLKGLIDEFVKITQMDSKEFAEYYKGA